MPKSFEEIKNEFVKNVRVSGRKTNNPVVVAIVGAIGSGKSTVAKELKNKLGWPIISKDRVRVMLREKGRGFKPEITNKIVLAMFTKIMRGGGNVIFDSDAVVKAGRKKLENFARRFHARVFYIRLTCDRDVMLERIVRGRYSRQTMFKSVVIALRDHTRRLPWHYRWSEKNGGQFILKKLPIKFIDEIDTTKPSVWKKKVRLISKKLARN